MKKYLFIVAMALSSCSYCQSVNFADDVACIIYSHCTRCHNSNTPMHGLSLNSYADVLNDSGQIHYYVENKIMPAYLPSTVGRHYAEEKNLTNDEIELIKEWIDSGCTPGNLANAPVPPVIINDVSALPSPDVSVRIPNYTATSWNEAYRQCFILTAPTTSIKFIDAIEVVPSDITAAYEYYVFADTSSIPVSLDGGDTAIGYTNFGGTGSSSAKPLYGWVNGNAVNYFPANIPLKIDSGSRIIVQVQYAEDAIGKLDSTQINIHYSPTTPARFLTSELLLSHENNLTNPPLFIQADSVKEFSESTVITNDITLYSISPILHLICISANVFAVTPANDTLSLFKTDKWKSIWSQGFYPFAQPIHLIAGTSLYADATFENTIHNSANPNNPPQDVSAGFGNEEEEMLFYFQATTYQSGDENLITDSVPHFTHYLGCTVLHQPSVVTTVTSTNTISISPNPADDFISINTFSSEKTLLSVYSPLGNKIFQTQFTGNYRMPVTEFPAGLYLFQLKSQNQTSTHKIILNQTQ